MQYRRGFRAGDSFSLLPFCRILPPVMYRAGLPQALRCRGGPRCNGSRDRALRQSLCRPGPVEFLHCGSVEFRNGLDREVICVRGCNSKRPSSTTITGELSLLPDSRRGSFIRIPAVPPSSRCIVTVISAILMKTTHGINRKTHTSYNPSLGISMVRRAIGFWHQRRRASSWRVLYNREHRS